MGAGGELSHPLRSSALMCPLTCLRPQDYDKTPIGFGIAV